MNTHFTSIRTVALILAMTSCVAATHAAGTIAFANSSLTRVQWNQGGGTTVPVPTTSQIVYGVFWGTNQDAFNLALPLGSNSTTVAGLIVAPSAPANTVFGTYAIPGTEAGQTVYLQIRAWSAVGNDISAYGATAIRQVTLGPEVGPGTVVWQSSTGTNPNKFTPMILGLPATPPARVTVGAPIEYSATVDEGSDGTIEISVPVNREGNSLQGLNFTSRVWLSTVDMTAIAGQDYVPTNVLVTFPPGEIHQRVTIKITGDAFPEPVEQFGVRLTASPDFISVSSYVFVVSIREAQVGSVSKSSTQATVSFPTTSRQRYAVDYSADLVSWLVVPGAENIQGYGGDVNVTNAPVACCDPRFYRLRLVP